MLRLQSAFRARGGVAQVARGVATHTAKNGFTFSSNVFDVLDMVSDRLPFPRLALLLT